MTPDHQGDLSKPGAFLDLLRRTAQADGWSVASRLIGLHWDRLLTRAPQALLDGIRELPGDVLIREPGFVVAANYLEGLVQGKDPGRFTHDARIDDLASADTQPFVHHLILLTGQVATARTAGRTDEVVGLIRSARAELDRCSPDERAQVRSTLPHLQLQWGRSLDAADLEGAVLEYESAYELAMMTEQRGLQRRAAAHLAWHHADRGALLTAERWIAQAEHLEQVPRYDAPLYLARALVKLDRNDFAGADVERTRLSAVPVGEYWAAAVWVECMSARTPAEALTSRIRLRQETERHTPDERTAPANSRYLRAARLRIELLRPTGGPIGPDRPTMAHEHMATAAQALQQKDYDVAVTHGGLAVAEAYSPRGFVTGLLVHAAALAALGRARQAAEAATDALAIIEPVRLYSPYRLLPIGAIDRLARQMPTDEGERLLAAAHGTSSPALAALTPRQTEVLVALLSDRPLAQIAGDLYISVNTLKTTLSRIYSTIGVAGRHEAAAFARGIGLR